MLRPDSTAPRTRASSRAHPVSVLCTHPPNPFLLTWGLMPHATCFSFTVPEEDVPLPLHPFCVFSLCSLSRALAFQKG